MALDFLPLKNALISLEKGLFRSGQNPQDLEIRDGCIQRFEYTYELCIKTIKRYIELEHSTTEKVDQLNFKDLLRLAGEVGLIQEAAPWLSFREARNNTSHANNENKAKIVFDSIPHFAKEAEFLISELEKRLP